MPWVIPTALLDMLAIAYPSRRYRSAVIGLIVHGSQTVVVLAVTLSLVLQ
jgi:CAAX protease family protein